MKIIDIQSQQGHLFTCDKCAKLHFEFNQIAMDFSSLAKLESLYSYLSDIQGDDFEKLNSDTLYVRKIHIPFPNTSVKMVLSHNDLKELKVLLTKFVGEYKRVEEEDKMMKSLLHISDRQLN